MLRATRSLLLLRVKGHRFVAQAKAEHVLPVDSRYTVFGPRPVRVLLFGGDYATGTNVRHRRDALDGALAALLHEHTGRGVIVENRSYPELPLNRLIASVGPSGAHTFDVVVWCPTFSEAVRRPFARAWRTSLVSTITFLRSTSTAGIVLLGIPQVLGSQPIAQLARTQAHKLNRAIASCTAARPHVLAVEPPAVDQRMIDERDGRTTYRAVALALLPAVLELLAVRANGSPEPRALRSAASESLPPA